MLIYHPASAKPFSRAEFEDFHRRNPHGFGVMWRARGRLRWRKGVHGAAVTHTLYRSLLNSGCREMALHWRYATAGAVCWANCHPVAVAPEMLMMHNGARIGPSTAVKSDSVVFAAHVLAPVLRERPWLIHTGWTADLERRIGTGNRLVIWDGNDLSPVIVGEGHGLWHKGRWYSNTYAWSAPQPRRYLNWPARADRHDFTQFLASWDDAGVNPQPKE